MKALKYSLIAFIAFYGIIVFSQNNERSTDNIRSSVQSDKNPDIGDYLFGEQKPDYKVISSNSSYIELEYYPDGLTKEDIEVSGERLSVYSFQRGLEKNISQSGSPDLRHRSFAVMFPSEKYNSVQIVDFDVKEEQNVNIAPIPQLNVFNPNVRNFENIYYTYNRNAEYSQNKFMPESVVSLADVGPFRDITIGNLVIYPCQYNPVTRTMKLYTRVRVRINFGEAPASLNRPRSKEEISLLTNAAINSNNAINWVSPKYKKNYRDNVVVNSALSTGDWFKIEIKDNSSNGTSDGMYKITKGFLEGAGINLSGIDPRTIKMYGNGGNMLPDRIAPDRPQDLEEIAVYIEGENDGTFDNNDHILFYGKSIHNWSYDSLARTYGHYLNVYSRSNYYWICLNTPNNGIRMQFVPSEQSGNPIVQASFFDRMFFEPEINNLINEGNLWLSERKSTGQSFEWNTSLPGLESGSDIVFNVKLASRTVQQPGGAQQSNYFLVKDEYSNMSEFQFPLDVVYPGFNEWISTRTYPITINQSQKNNGEQVKLRSRFYSTLNEGEGYLDWYEIVYKRRLNSAANDILAFDSPDTSGTVEYNVSSFSNNDIKVFDASVHKNVKIIQPISVNSSNVKFQKTETNARLSRFYVVGQSGYKTPTGISSRVTNQNLHGISDGASFIIITHKDLISAAERLKNKREQGGASDPNYLKTMVVTTEQIFHEFSGGVFDAVAVRDFIKYAYENWTEKPVYVCLLGDGGFDYKNLLYQGGNYVPAWELTSPVIHQVAGLTTDDYFVNVVDGTYLIDKPDLGVGRIPANSLPDANAYLDKLDAYENGENNGYWKNRMLFVADDEKTTAPQCEGIFHLAQCESLAEDHAPPFIDKIKVYLATYPTVITPQGRRKPQVNSDIAKYWSEGVLNIHWTGHGSPDVWAHEYVLEKDNILSQINNRNRYPFVSIASCDMSKFDNPANQSAGELFMMAYNKGAIGTFAASRPVYASGNAALMYVVFDNLYIPRDSLLLPKRFGTGMLNAKLQINPYDDNSAKYILMCDPSARVQLPRFRSHVDSISGLQGDTMQALSRIKIHGSILNHDSTLWNSYNGKLVLKLYDVDKQIVLLEDCNPPIPAHNFRLNGGIIYSGTQNISNGKWTAEFIVPKDISYRNQPGRLINYFFNNQYDGAGINRSFIVGGVNPNAAIDSTGPHISMFLNSRNFRSGDIVNENFKFIADLSDESGINTTGTIGHKLEGVLDGNENIKYDFTNFYNSDTTYTSGSIEFDFTNIAIGRHTLKLKAWDTYNNSSENTIEFDVSSGGVLQVTNVYNFPNPFKDNTAFTFQHNYPTNINIKIKVYTVAGRLIKQIERQNIADKFVMIDWDGKDEDGETLGNGVYIYRLVVESIDGSSITNTGKLAVLK
ncbi:MAG: type IX secretion system sortase PorU [Ignavibacteria bacterium]|nr:type IX secretion system sortase PorU [Ignavibacteria bacterium]